MKELETHLKTGINSSNRTELNVKKQQEVEYVLQGKLKPKKGHFIWELNEETGEIKKAEYKKDTITLNAFAKPISEKLIINPGCVYIPALNIENVKRKYLKNKEQSFYFATLPLLNLNDLTF